MTTKQPREGKTNLPMVSNSCSVSFGLSTMKKYLASISWTSPTLHASMGSKTFDQDTATLREYFDLEVAYSTIAYDAKQGYFRASNEHDLRVQFQTAMDFLELLVTCKKSVVTKGLKYILEPTRWRRMSTLIHDRYQSEKGFGSTFLYSAVDRTVQIFLDRTTTTSDDNGQPRYLLLKAQELIDKVKDGLTLNITLHKVLMAAGGTERDKIVEKPTMKKARPSTPTSKSPQKVSFYANPSEVHTNVNKHASWKVPESQNFLELLNNQFSSGKPWPRCADTQIPKTNRKIRVVPLCARFQMTDKCIQGWCGLAHMNADKISESEFPAVDKIISVAIMSKSKT